MLAKKNYRHQSFNQLLKNPPKKLKENMYATKGLRNNAIKYYMISEFIGKDPYLYAQPHIPQSTLEILNGQVSQNQQEKLNTCERQSKFRTKLQYGQGLIQNWILEINIQERIEKKGTPVERCGADKNFELLRGNEIDGRPDFLICGEQFEVQADYKSHYSTTGTMHLRPDKYKNQFKYKSNLLLIDVERELWAIVKPEECKSMFIKEHKPWNGEPAWELVFPTDTEWISTDDMDLDFYYFNKDMYFGKAV